MPMEFNIRVERTQQSRLSSVDFNNIPFGRVFSDHMFVVDYKDGAWHDPRIVPFGNFEIHPAAMATSDARAACVILHPVNVCHTPAVTRSEW